MKAIFLSVIFLGTVAFGQEVHTTIEGNNVRAHLSTIGNFFQNVESSASGYETPKDEGNHLIYVNNFWFGAVDAGGNLKMCASFYNSDESRDIYRGAIKADGTAEAPEDIFAGDIYVVSREEILFHAANYDAWDYTAPDAISNWPAHGDLALELAANLAPFADLNGNGTYEPELGEYPEIRGDHAAYLIMNDMGGIHSKSGGESLGIEVHFMFYQYEEVGDINNTTFVNVRVINRSTNNYPEFIVGNYMDGDVGFAGENYMGCDSANNVIYIYSGDLIDPDGDGDTGFPSVGITSLNHKMNAGVFFDNGAGPYGFPSSAVDYWNYMNATWKNGVHIENPDGAETNYMFSGNPNPVDGDETWSETTAGNPPGDRRALMSSESIFLEAGGVRCFDYAIITEQEGNSLENAVEIINQAEEVKVFYDSQPNTYCDFTVGLPSENVINELKVYPNPSTGTFRVETNETFDIALFALDGRRVYDETNKEGNELISPNLATGTYVVQIKQKTKMYQMKLIIE